VLFPFARYIHYQTNEALSSNSAEAEDLELYMTNVRTGIDPYSKTQEEIGTYERHLGTVDMLKDSLWNTETPGAFGDN
jgi:hypothetical protein